MNTKPTKSFMTSKEAAAMLGIGRRRFQQIAKERALAWDRIGNVDLYRIKDVETLAAERQNEESAMRENTPLTTAVKEGKTTYRTYQTLKPVRIRGRWFLQKGQI